MIPSRPAPFVIKSDKALLIRLLEDKGYVVFPMSINILAVHKDDPVSGQVGSDGSGIWLK